MTFRQITAEQQRRDLERRRFADIDRRLTAESKVRVSRGKDPRARQAIKRRVITAIIQLPKVKQALFITREATRAHEEIKKQTRKIPTLQDIGVAGYKYGKAHPNSARLIYNSLDAKAKIIRRIVPKEAGIPIGKAMFAFSDGAIKGIRNEPIKTLAFFALPGVAGVAIKGARYIPIASKMVKSKMAMKAASHIFNVAYTHNVYTRVNAPVYDSYKDGKITETRKTLPDGSIQVTTKTEQIPVGRKPTTKEKAERLGYIFSTEAAPMVGGAKVASSISKAKYGKLSRTAKTTTKTTAKKLKKGTKEFIKAEKAEAQLIRKKKKRLVQKLVQIQKPEPKIIRVSEIIGLAKTPEVVLIKDPKAIALAKSNQELLKEAKALVKIKTRPLKQRELLEFEKSTPEALKHVDQSIEQQLKQLNNVKAVVTQKNVKTKIRVITKEYNKIKTINSELRAKHKLLSKQYTQLKSLLKAKRTAAAKQKISNLVKSIAKTQSGIKVLLGRRGKVLTKIRTEIVILRKQKEIIKAVPLLKKITKIEPVPKKITKKITKKPPKKPPRVPVKKPPVKPPIIPKVPPIVIPKKRKVKPKKKKKMTDAQYRDWFVKNEIPTLKSLYG